MRRIILIALAFTATASTGGCAGGQSKSPDTDDQITRSQVVAYAHSVNLRAEDLPGWRASLNEPDANEAGLEAEIARCVGLPVYGARVAIESPRFTSGTRLVGSRVGAALLVDRGSATLATADARNLAAFRSPRGRTCQVQFFDRYFNRPGVRATVTSSRAPLSGVDGCAGLRVRATVSVRKTGGLASRQIALYEDVFVLDQGAAGIDLYAISYFQPFPLQTERRLLALLHSRAEANKL